MTPQFEQPKARSSQAEQSPKQEGIKRLIREELLKEFLKQNPDAKFRLFKSDDAIVGKEVTIINFIEDLDSGEVIFRHPNFEYRSRKYIIESIKDGRVYFKLDDRDVEQNVDVLNRMIRDVPLTWGLLGSTNRVNERMQQGVLYVVFSTTE